MKRIGILFGQERSFPLALVARINEKRFADVVADPVKIGGLGLVTPRRYDLVLDRISQDIPFYRAVLKKLALDGTVVVNNPFWWSADDKFTNNVLARELGVAVPKTVLLPSKHHPPDTTAESMTNLEYPLDWEGIFSYVGFPAYLKPHSGGGWKSVYRVKDAGEFFSVYDRTGHTVMMLQEEIAHEAYYRCYVIGRRHVRIMRWEPALSFFERYVRNPPPMDRKLESRIREDCLKLATALGYEFDTAEFAVRDGVPYAIDFLNPAPDADVASVGQENFEWVVATTADWLVERVGEEAEPPAQLAWPAWLGRGREKTER